MQRDDPSIEAKPFFLGSGFGSLPDPQRYPDLVKVFLDAQHDYIEDRVYLLAALVAGPAKTVEVVDMTTAPPDTAAEQALLLTWLTRLLPAIAAVAGTTQAPLHLYLYDQRDQGVLLTALTRHFDALCAIPAFYDLLTASPALTQGMVSFLADEVRERRNLAPICQNLYRVASALGFAWREGELDFWQKFRRGRLAIGACSSAMMPQACSARPDTRAKRAPSPWRRPRASGRRSARIRLCRVGKLPDPEMGSHAQRAQRAASWG